MPSTLLLSTNVASTPTSASPHYCCHYPPYLPLPHLLHLHPLLLSSPYPSTFVTTWLGRCSPLPYPIIQATMGGSSLYYKPYLNKKIIFLFILKSIVIPNMLIILHIKRSFASLLFSFWHFLFLGMHILDPTNTHVHIKTFHIIHNFGNLLPIFINFKLLNHLSLLATTMVIKESIFKYIQ